jgi:hypothetical protein
MNSEDSSSSSVLSTCEVTLREDDSALRALRRESASVRLNFLLIEIAWYENLPDALVEQSNATSMSAPKICLRHYFVFSRIIGPAEEPYDGGDDAYCDGRITEQYSRGSQVPVPQWTRQRDALEDYSRCLRPARIAPPEQHLVDAGCVDAKLLIASQTEYLVDLVGPDFQGSPRAYPTTDRLCLA